MHNLLVVACSTRPSRIGFPFAEWTAERAAADGRFTVEIADLRELDLPNYDEPHHPRMHRYENDHTKAWSHIVERADAIIFVTPEYNHGFPGSLKTAIDFLHDEWKFKPAACVSYGGIAAGTRAVQMLKPVLSCLQMIPVYEGINIAFPGEYLKDGRFNASKLHEDAAKSMFDSLDAWAGRNASLYVRHG